MIEAAQQNHTKLMIAYRLHFEAGNLEAIHVAKSGKEIHRPAHGKPQMVHTKPPSREAA
jgi:predicted dehydrogenase